MIWGYHWNLPLASCFWSSHQAASVCKKIPDCPITHVRSNKIYTAKRREQKGWRRPGQVSQVRAAPHGQIPAAGGPGHRLPRVHKVTAIKTHLINAITKFETFVVLSRKLTRDIFPDSGLKLYGCLPEGASLRMHAGKEFEDKYGVDHCAGERCLCWSDLCNGGGTAVSVHHAKITAAVTVFIMAVAGFRRQDGIMYVPTAMPSVFE